MGGLVCSEMLCSTNDLCLALSCFGCCGQRRVDCDEGAAPPSAQRQFACAATWLWASFRFFRAGSRPILEIRARGLSCWYLWGSWEFWLLKIAVTDVPARVHVERSQYGSQMTTTMSLE